MRADFFTKPLEGMLFYRLHDLIMNLAPESPYHSSHRSVLQDTDESNDNPAKSAQGKNLIRNLYPYTYAKYPD